MSTHVFDNVTMKQILTLDTVGTLISKNADLHIIGDASRHIVLTTSGDGNIRQSNGDTSKTAFVGTSQSSYTVGQNKTQLFQIILPSSVSAGDIKVYIKLSDQMSGIRFEEYRGGLQMSGMTLYQLAVCGNISTNLGCSGMTAFNMVNAAGATIVTFQYTISVANACDLNIWYFVEWLGDTNATVSGMTSAPVNISSVPVSASAPSGAIINTMGTAISLPISATSATNLSQFIDDITPPLYAAISSNTSALSNVNSIITIQSGSLLSENAILLDHTGSLANVSSSITSLNTVLIANTNSLSVQNLTINAASSSITSLTNAIAPLSNLGTYVATSLTTLNQITMANSASISTLQNMVQTSTANATSASANIGNLNVFTVTASQSLLSIQSSLSGVQNNQAILTGSVSFLSTSVGSSLGAMQLVNASLTTAITSVQTGLVFVSGSLSSNSGNLSTVSGQLSTVSNAVSSLQSGQTQQAGILTLISASISSQNATIVQSNASLSNSISIAQTALSVMSNSISANTSSISSINIAVNSSTGTILTGSISAAYGSLNQAYIGNLASGGVLTQQLTTTNGQLSLIAGGAGANSYTALAAATDISGQMIMFINGSARTSDGGTLTGTIRNDAGGDMRFITSSSQGLYLQASSGNLGINTATPAYTVDVTAGTIAAGALNLPGSNTVNFGSDNLTKAAFAGNIGYQLATANALDVYGAGSAVGSRSVKLWDNIQVPGTIYANQLGVNTSTPSYSVDVNGSVRVAGSSILGNYFTDSSVGTASNMSVRVFNISYAMGSQSSTALNGTGGQTSYFVNQDYNFYGNSGPYPGGRLQVLDDNYSADFRFQTKTPGAAGNGLVERLSIIGNTGNIGINNASPSFSLDVNGGCRIAGGLSVGGTFNQVPPGTIHQYGGSTAPAGFLLCDGSSYSIYTYAALFAVISTTYGSTSSTTFNVPNMQGRVVVGQNSNDALFRTLGQVGGESYHTLTSSEMPSHTHTLTDPGHNHGVTDYQHNHQVLGGNPPSAIHSSNRSGTSGFSLNDASGDGSGTAWSTANSNSNISINNSSTGISTITSSSGSNTPHLNLQPYIVTFHIIKI